MKIFLIGLPGSGKTTVGRKLAATLQLPFVDLDKEIEKAEGQSIPTIFKDKKEEYFRKVESAQLKLWANSNDEFVMATGGGAPCFFDNMEVIKATGQSIFLDVPASEIAKRISRTRVEQRPLLAGRGQNVEELKDHIEFMRSNRISYYKQASITLTGNTVNIDDIITQLRS